MKRLPLMMAAITAAFFIAVACTTTPGASPAQQAVNATATACKNIDAAIVAADQAVKSGVLKGQDARNALKAFTAAQAGCVSALTVIQTANAAATAASGAKP